MAISVAQCGGIGVIHRFNSIVQQVEIIEKVKRAESFKIDEPYTCSPTSTVENVAPSGLIMFYLLSFVKHQKIMQAKVLW